MKFYTCLKIYNQNAYGTAIGFMYSVLGYRQASKIDGIGGGHQQIETDNKLQIRFLYEHCVTIVKCFIATGMFYDQ